MVHSTNSEPSTRLLELDRPSRILLLLQLAAHNNVLLVEVVALMSLAVNSGTHAKHISSDEKIGAVSFHKKEKKGGGIFITHWQVEIGSQFLIGMPGAHV